jgi:vitamin B12 transporter
MRHYITGILVIFCLVQRSFSQEQVPDTTMMLDDVSIISERIGKFAQGQIVQTLDSMTRKENPGGSLSELIPGYTSAYVRNYGQGTLATLSIRGTSANQSGLLWNGIRVAPPNIGYVDLSLVQGNFFHEVSVLNGGASPMFGSGLIGGGVHLNNRPVFDKKSWNSQIGLSAGSYGTLMSEGSLDFTDNRFYSHTAYSVGGSKNNFPYSDLEGDKTKLENSAFFKSGFLQDLAVKLSDNQYLMGSVWFQYAGREIPATLTETGAGADQLDRSWRTMLRWKKFTGKGTFEAKGAYFNEFTRYEDPESYVYSVIRSQSAVAAFESTYSIFKRSTVFGGISYTYEYADLDYYASPEHQQSLALYASWLQPFESIQWQVSVNVRQEFLTDVSYPFLYSIGAEGQIWHDLSGRISFSRNFRAPTLNEMYWQPGGNPELQPEDSYNLEGGVSLNHDFGKNNATFSLTGFSSWVDNWILWLQVPGGSYWAAENAQEVWSRGIEANIGSVVYCGAIKLFLCGSYTMTFSTNEKKTSENDASYNKQLIYTPVHRFLVKPGVAWHGFDLTMRGSYTGKIYTTKDNETSLPGYFLLDAIISKNFNIHGKNPLTLQINLNNITNKEYEVVPYRPMPGINVLGTVVVAIGKGH